MGTVVVVLLLAGAIGMIVRKMVKDKKEGRSLHCGGDCGHCSGSCHK